MNEVAILLGEHTQPSGRLSLRETFLNYAGDNRATVGGVEGGQDYAIPYITTLTRLILQSVTTSVLLEDFVIIRGVFM